MNYRKKVLSLAMALFLLIGCLTGCKSDAVPGFASLPDPDETSDGSAMGRYVEEDVSIPESAYPLDMVMLDTGFLRFAAVDENQTRYIYTMTADGSWETMSLSSEITESGSVASLALAADGRIFCYCLWYHRDEAQDDLIVDAHHLWLMDASGGCREIPNTYPDMDSIRFNLISDCDFTSDGKLMVMVGTRELMELNTETGAFGENQNDLGIFNGYLSCAGEDTYLVGAKNAIAYSDGEAKHLTDPAGEQMIRAAAVHEWDTEKNFTLWKNQEGYLFFSTSEGLFSYVPGGSVVEELVDGDRTTLGDPGFFAKVMTGGEDGSFYILGENGNTVLYHYVYDETVSTEPGTTLRIYSLREDDSLRQTASLFQKAYPNIAVDLEIGMTGEDGVTEADAVKALNTQILAGSGPDVLNLDGLPLDSFLEKGVLADLRDALNQSGPLLTQVTNCFASDGKVCAVPTAFAIPAMYGPEDILSQIHDMDSLVSAVGQALEYNPEGRSAMFTARVTQMADGFYDGCSASWRKSDGTLDEKKLAEYYAGMKGLFDLDADFRESLGDSLYELEPYNVGEYTRLSKALNIQEGVGCTAGTLEGMDGWSVVLAGDQDLQGYDTLPQNIQAAGVFLPQRIMGILNTSKERTAAETFLAYMLSDQTQVNMTDSFPVNQTAFDRQIAEERKAEGSYSSSYKDGRHYSADALYPDARRRQMLKGWVDALTTPALTDTTIRKLVMEQMDDCCNGKITPEEAAQAALRSLNLYLSE